MLPCNDPRPDVNPTPHPHRLPRLVVAGSRDGPLLQVTLQVGDHGRPYAVAGLRPRNGVLLPEGLAHGRAPLHQDPVRGQAVGGPAVEVDHPHLGHPVRGRGRGFGAQGGQLAVPGLLPVEGGVVDGVGGAGPAVGARGADGGTMESAESVFRTVEPRVWVRPVGTGHAQPPLLEQVGVRVVALAAPGQTVAFAAQVLVRLDVPPLQDGAGTGRVGAGCGAGGGHPLPWDSGATGSGALPGTEGDPGGRGGHGVGSGRERSLNGVVQRWAHGGLPQRVGVITAGVQHLAVHLEEKKKKEV